MSTSSRATKPPKSNRLVVKFERDDSGQTLIQIDLDDATVLRVPAERLNTVKKFQSWVRRQEVSGWMTVEIMDELWHACAVAFEWP